MANWGKWEATGYLCIRKTCKEYHDLYTKQLFESTFTVWAVLEWFDGAGEITIVANATKIRQQNTYVLKCIFVLDSIICIFTFCSANQKNIFECDTICSPSSPSFFFLLFFYFFNRFCICIVFLFVLQHIKFIWFSSQ